MKAKVKEMVTVEQLANMIDHTNLKAFADDAAFEKLCDEAKKYNFKMVAINPAQTVRCKKKLEGSPVHVGAAIGFPLGQTTLECKIFETKDAIEKGADEIDYVINVAELKNKNYDYIKKEMEEIVKICREAGKTSKVIFENCYLTDDEKRKVAEIAKEVKPDFIKTSTGFGTGGATVEDVRCKKKLEGSPVHVGAAIGFPLGQTTLECKIFETKDAIEKGADEIDYVINVAELKNKNYDYIKKEMEEIVKICREAGKTSKVIFENCYLTDDEKRKVAEIAKEVKPDFIKTSTGFGTGGATVEDVKLMKSVVGDEVKVKAAGGIRDLKTALAMIEAGAERLGTSAGVAIVEEYNNQK